MKALLLSSYRHLELAELPVPALAPDEVLVRIAACGICGSDVHGYDGSSGRRIPPIVMGHEAAGTISAIGSAITGFDVGDRVTFDSTIFCGKCAYCLRGQTNLCDHRQVFGVSCGDYRRNGAFAEYLVVPQRILYHLPENLSFQEAAMLEAVSVALHAVSLSAIRPGDSALVMGAGMIGLLALQALRAAGCAAVYVTDLDPIRLKLAQQLGATATLPAAKEALIPAILERTQGSGVDVVVEAVGQGATVASAVGCTRKGGTVTLVGNIAAEVPVPLQKIVTRQIRLQGSCAIAGEYPQAIEFLANGKITVKSMISAVVPLEEGQQWFDRLYARDSALMKVLLTP
ncbi:MAG TPA: galactitol-1-phosphate 5-dehydrogenase [Terriglobales bacterium]